jgi:methyl-accepting chemotaxis protein
MFGLKPRRKLFVDKHVQGALLYRIAIYWCFSVLIICLITLCAQAITQPNRPFLEYFAFNKFFVQYGPIVLTSLVLVPLIMFDVVAISNRFVGPLFRMRRSMRALAAGMEVEPIHFREKDFWQEVAQEFNLVLGRVEELKHELAETKQQLAEAQSLQSAVHE